MSGSKGRSRRGLLSYNAMDTHRGTRNTGSLRVDAKPFAAGASRVAYKARVATGCVKGYTEGSYGVIKVFKRRFRDEGHEVSDKDELMQREVAALADLFNDECDPLTDDGEHTCKIHVRDAAHVTLLINRTVHHALFEREIRGDWTKFTSNTGYSRGEDDILDAFAHWTYHVSKHRLLVCDLQGHRGGYGARPKEYAGERFYYLLTDPAINSVDRRYGMNDLGQRGIQAFFDHHNCNAECHRLGLHGDRLRRSTRASETVPMAAYTTYHSELDMSSSYAYGAGAGSASAHGTYRRDRYEPGLGAITDYEDDDDSDDDSDW